LHDSTLWELERETGVFTPRESLCSLIDRDLSNPISISSRDNYYYPITHGLYYYIQDRPKTAFRHLAIAARPSDFYRVVKEDYGGGASFAKAYPSHEDLFAQSAEQFSKPTIYHNSVKTACLTFSVHMDFVYMHAFANDWIQRLRSVSNSGIALHLNLIFPAHADTEFFDSLITKAKDAGLQLMITFEQSCAHHRAYYASSRFIHGKHILQDLKTPVLFCDADSFLTSPEVFLGKHLSALLADQRILGLITGGPYNGYLPWRKFSGGWLFVTGSDESLAFLDLTRRAISYFWDNIRPTRNWWIDQVGLEVAYRYCSVARKQAFADIHQCYPGLMSTSEEHKIACISRVPFIADVMSSGKTFWESLRIFQDFLATK
jgi:hypothetical protein